MAHMTLATNGFGAYRKAIRKVSFHREMVKGGEIFLIMQNLLQNKIAGYSGYSFDWRSYLAATANF